MTDTALLLQSFEKVHEEISTPRRDELLDIIADKMRERGISLELEIKNALVAVRAHIYHAYAMRSLAADIISQAPEDDLESTEEIAERALHIAKDIYAETHRAVSLEDIDGQLSESPEFEETEAFIQKANELGQRFSDDATAKQDFSSIKSAMKPNGEITVLSFLSALAQRLDEPKSTRRVKGLIGMEISKLSYLRKNILDEDGFSPIMNGQAEGLNSTGRTVAMRGLSKTMGQAGKLLGENQFVVDSLDIAEVIDDSFIRSWTFQDLGKIIGDSSVGRYAFERAIEGARDIDNSALQVLTLTSMVEDYLTVAGEAQARPFMDYLQEVSRSIEADDERALSLTNTISAVGRISDEEDALAIERTLLLAGTNDDADDMLNTLSTLSDNLVKAVDREDTDAHEALKATLDEVSDSRTFPMAAAQSAGPEKGTAGIAAGISTGAAAGGTHRSSEESDADTGQKRPTDANEEQVPMAPITGIISAGLKGLQRDMKNMTLRLRTIRDVDSDHVAFLLGEALAAGSRHIKEHGPPHGGDAVTDRKIELWLGSYGISPISDRKVLPLLYPLHDNIRLVEARVAQLQTRETLLLKYHVDVKEQIGQLQGHIREYEELIGDNPKIYKLEATFLKLMRKEESAIKRISPTMEKEVSEHWKIARKFLLEFRKRPEIATSKAMRMAIEGLDETHRRSVAMIQEHAKKLINLKGMVKKIDTEIVTALDEYRATGKAPEIDPGS